MPRLHKNEDKDALSKLEYGINYAAEVDAAVPESELSADKRPPVSFFTQVTNPSFKAKYMFSALAKRTGVHLWSLLVVDEHNQLIQFGCV